MKNLPHTHTHTHTHIYINIYYRYDVLVYKVNPFKNDRKMLLQSFANVVSGQKKTF